MPAVQCPQCREWHPASPNAPCPHCGARVVSVYHPAFDDLRAALRLIRNLLTALLVLLAVALAAGVIMALAPALTR